ECMTFKVTVNTFKFLMILGLTLSIPNISYSQKLVIGFKAGASLSKSRFADKDDNNEFTNLWKPGLLFGAISANLPVKKNFSFLSEVGFSQRGRKIEFNEGTWLNNSSYQFIDGSLLLRKSFPLNWSRNQIGSWFINIGPKISYWISGHGKIIADGESTDYTIKFQNQPENPVAPDFYTMYLSDVNRWLLGIDFGIGVDAPSLALEKFTFELRFTSGQTYYGEKNSAYYPAPEFSDNLLANEKMISLSVHYSLNRDSKEGKQGKSTKNDVKRSKPRKNFDSVLH
ncbi:MAG TPA: porin family protein, partial [Ignavibacteriaceae bacterium]